MQWQEPPPSVAVYARRGAAYRGPQRLRIAGAAGYLVLLALLFVQPLSRLVLQASRRDLHSHSMPFVAGYLLYLLLGRLSTIGRGSLAGAAAMGGAGLAALVGGIGWSGCLSANDELALMVLAFVASAAFGAFLFIGSKWMSAAAFPAAFALSPAPFFLVLLWLRRQGRRMTPPG